MLQTTHKRTVDIVLLCFQSEMFNSLLEEAERMHIKRKEAAEMLKVITKQTNAQQLFVLAFCLGMGRFLNAVYCDWLPFLDR